MPGASCTRTRVAECRVRELERSWAIRRRPMITETLLDCRRHRCRCATIRDHEPAGAGVAVLALPIGLDVFAEVLENEPRAALGALTVVDHRAELGAVLNAALLVIGEVGAQVDRRQFALQPLPASSPVLAHESVALEQHEHDPRFAPRD